MKMKKQLLNLHFGNKAFVFSIDMIIAVTIVATLLIASTFYITKAGDESISKLQTIRIGSDVLALLDYKGTLDTQDAGHIETEMNSVLAINHEMRIKIDCDGNIVETTATPPEDRFIGAGKRVFVTDEGEYCIADFTIWLK